MFLSGCVSMGNKIDQEKISKIQEGITTEAQVVELLGSPYGKSVTDDGKVKMDYVFLRMEPKARNFIPIIGLLFTSMKTEKQTLQILIGKDGKVEKQTLNKNNA